MEREREMEGGRERGKGRARQRELTLCCANAQILKSCQKPRKKKPKEKAPGGAFVSCLRNIL